MPPRRTPKKKSSPRRAAPTLTTLAGALEALEQRGTNANRLGLARYGITAPKAFGVPMTAIQALAKLTGKSHPLALELWKSGWYEARLLSCFVAEPERVTAPLMDRWAKDFDNWAVCDTACFHLFDRTPLAFAKIDAWSKSDAEFVKRGAFALLASVALHDRALPDAAFARSFVLIERAATDPRNFVKKAVLWALRGVGGRSPALNEKAVACAKKLVSSDDQTSRWIGKSALRELTSPAARRRLATQRAKKK